MSQLFAFDGPLFRALSTLADVVIVNFLWLISSLPIITIGPASEAAYYVLAKMKKGEDAHIIKLYFKEFKNNFKNSFFAGLILIGAGFIVAADCYIMRIFSEGKGDSCAFFMKALGMAFVISYAIVFAYLIPLLATFDSPLKKQLLNSMLFGLRRFYVALTMTFITALPVFVFYFNQQLFIKSFVLWLMLGFAGPAYINVIIFRLSIRQYLPKDKED